MLKRIVREIRFAIAFIAFAFAPVAAQDLNEFEKRVSEFALPNGLHFLVVERHEAPVVSFHTYVNAGAIDDPAGSTGLAHMFEHMAFKGTETIGTTDWPREKKALDEIERAYDELEAERAKGPRAKRVTLETLEAGLKIAINRAQDYVASNEYTRIVEENGGVGLNAGTGVAATEYYYSLPSNRIELWFLMESQRYLHPVVPRVLQRARRSDGGVSHAGGIESAGSADSGFPRRRFRSAPLPQPAGRMAQRYP